MPANRAIAQIGLDLLVFQRNGNIETRLKCEQTFKRGIADGSFMCLLDSEAGIYLWEMSADALPLQIQIPHNITALSWTRELFCGSDDGFLISVSPGFRSFSIILDLGTLLPEEAQTSVIGICPMLDTRLVIGCPQHLAVVSEGTVLLLFDMKVCSEVINIGTGLIAAVRTYQSKVVLYSIEDTIDDKDEEEAYEDDFEDEPEETKADTPVQVPRNEEITVILKFEPSLSGLLRPLPVLPLPKKPLPAPSKKKQLQDKPVTFHKKVKSSGYCTNPKLTQKRPSASRKIAQISSAVPITPDPANVWTGPNLHSGPIFQVAYSPDGTKIGSCGSDSTSFLMKLPGNRYKWERTPLIGHVQSVTGLSWSANSALVLTTSTDKTSKMWTVAGTNPGQCLLTVSMESACSQFYYRDRFLAFTDTEKVKLFTYQLTDPNEKDDVKRLQAKCRYKERAAISHPSAQTVTRFLAHNLFHSHILILAGSNKTLSVWDVDRLAEVSSLDDPHRKSIHCLRFFRGSGDTLSPEDCNLFLTAAADNELHIFDLRVSRLVSTLLGHQNTSQELTGDVSPAGMMVGYGSEDRAAYLWDLRTGRLLEKLRGFRDVVSAVEFGPAGGQMCVGSYDGGVSFFAG